MFIWCRSSVKASTNGANQQPVNLSLLNQLDIAGRPVNAVFPNSNKGVCLCSKYIEITAAVWIFTKHGFSPVSESLTPVEELNTRKLAFLPFPKAFGIWHHGLPISPALRSAWSQPENTGYPCSMFLRNPALSPSLTPSIPSLRKATRPTVRTPSGFATCSCVT